MYVVIAYDVSTTDKAGARRLREMARISRDAGRRVQKSVFECRFASRREWEVTKNKLLACIDRRRDRLRFYFLSEGAASRIESFGKGSPKDDESDLVVV